MEQRAKWFLVFLITIGLGLPALAHKKGTNAYSVGASTTQYDSATYDNRTGDVTFDDDSDLVDEDAWDVRDTSSATSLPSDRGMTSDSTTETDRNREIHEKTVIREPQDSQRTLINDTAGPDVNIESTGDVIVTPAVAETRTERPRFLSAAIHLIPTAGAASFTTQNRATLENFDDGFTGGLFVDFGSRALVFETGILALNVNGNISEDEGNFNVDSWGIPVLAKMNFSGNPKSGVFAKLGVMPFQPTGTSGDIDVLGVAGLGGAIPLFTNTSLTVEATYNRIVDDNGSLGSYQGVAVLGGLQFGL